MLDFINPLTLGIVGVVLAVLVLVAIIVKRYKIAEPDEAIIVTGRKGKSVRNDEGEVVTDLSGQKVVTGGGVFVVPFVQRSFKLSLRSRRLLFQTVAQTKDGITISADAVAVIKVGGSEEAIRSAAQRFLSQQEEIESSTQEVLSGSLRGIIGSLTVTDIIRDRVALATAVLQAAEDALTKQGLVVDTLQIQGITDKDGYIANLGRPEAANVRRAAEVADTEASRASQQAKIQAEQSILENQRELAIRQAAVKAETDRAAAIAAAARPLEEATQRQAVVAQEEITAEKEASLREQQLNAEVRKVADAEAYRVQVEAEAAAKATRLRASAQAEAVTVQGVAEADSNKARGLAEAEINKARGLAAADASRAEGLAAAEVVKERGLAEAEGIKAKAQAFLEQKDAILAEKMVDILPAMAGKFSDAIRGISNMTVISADGANSQVNQVAGGMASTMEAMKQATGIDFANIINGGVTGRAVGQGIASEADTQ